MCKDLNHAFYAGTMCILDSLDLIGGCRLNMSQMYIGSPVIAKRGSLVDFSLLSQDGSQIFLTNEIINISIKGQSVEIS